MGLDENQDKKLEELYREMFRPCFVYAVNALGDENLAEEAVQDAFRIACEKADKLFSSQNPRGWLFKTLKNVIRSIKRTRAQTGNIIALISAEAGSYTACDGEDIHLLYSGIVSDEEFALLKRISVDGYSMLEAAEELGISLEACKKRIQRARQKFKKFLEK